MKLVTLAECHANACIAEEVSNALKESGIELDVKHKPIYGRDRILKEASTIVTRLPPNALLVLFIDFEVGPLRVYVERLFSNLVRVNPSMSVFVGSGLGSKSLAIVFDPNLEEALRIRDPELRRHLKSSEACEKLRPILREPNYLQLVREIAAVIAEKAGKHHGSDVAYN